MTRRADPDERVKELGDASVPELFDIHAYIYSEDAPSLEKFLHNEFSKQRVNLVNHRKEFFKVDVQSVVKALDNYQEDYEIELEPHKDTDTFSSGIVASCCGSFCIALARRYQHLSLAQSGSSALTRFCPKNEFDRPSDSRS